MPGLGGGTELAQLRPYEAGDDARRFDAPASARTGILHVREHLPEHALAGEAAVTLGKFSASSERIASQRVDLVSTHDHQQEEQPRMLTPSRKTLTAMATVSALAAGGAALAGAATSSTSSTQRPAQTALTGDTADKVKAAALAKVPGATVLRVEEGGPYATKYHAHVRKSDGTEVVVLVDADFKATSVEEHMRP